MLLRGTTRRVSELPRDPLTDRKRETEKRQRIGTKAMYRHEVRAKRRNAVGDQYEDRRFRGPKNSIRPFASLQSLCRENSHSTRSAKLYDKE